MLQTESAGGIVLNNKDLVLVVSQYGTSWSLPKGHIEPGESKILAARREILEETGIKDLKLIKELGSYQRYKIGKDGKDDTTELKTIFIFLFKTNENQINPIDQKNPKAKWVQKEKVADLLTHPKDSKFYFNVLGKI